MIVGEVKKSCFIITLWICHVIIIYMHCILENQLWYDHKNQLKSAFMYYLFKVKYLKRYFIDLVSVKSTKITIFSRWKLRHKLCRMNITEFMNKQYFEIIKRLLILTIDTSGSNNWLLIPLRRSIQNRSLPMKTQYSSWVFMK